MSSCFINVEQQTCVNYNKDMRQILVLVLLICALICMNGVKCWNLEIKGRTSVTEGDELSLTCNGTGFGSPLANFDWYKDSKILTPSERVKIAGVTKIMQTERMVSSSLTIEDVNKEDSGRYKCLISDNISKYIDVRVNEKEKGNFPNNFGTSVEPGYYQSFVTVCNIYVILYIVF